MKAPIEISAKIDELNECINLIDNKRNEEIQKPFYTRNYQFLTFLDRERKIHEFAIKQLNWLLD